MSTVTILNPDEFARKRFLGQKLTNREWAKKICDLSLGNQVTGSRPKNWSEITSELEVDRKFIYKLRDLALELKLLQLEDGVYKKAKISKLNYHPSANMSQFCEIPEIQKWVDYMATARYGEPLGTRANKLSTLKNLCDTLEIHPTSIISGETPLEVYRNGDTLIEEFVKLYDAGKSTVKTRKKKADLNKLRYTYVQARNSFSRCFGYQYPQKFSNTSAQSVKPFHALYSDVMLSPEQIKQAMQYLIDNYGIDSDIFRWVMFGMESCARKEAIRNCKINYDKVKFYEKEAYVLQVFESKTQHLKKGIYEKFITIPELQQSIDAVAKRGSFLIEKRSDTDLKKLYKEIKKLYKFLKLENKWLTDVNEAGSGYCMKHPTHALRHFGCQLWLQRLGFSAIGLVAIMGGWHTIDEAKASYGAISRTELLNEVGRVWK